MDIQEKQQELKRIFEKNDIVLAYIFGSVAKGRTGPLSDLDFAVLFSKDMPREEYFDGELKVAGEIGRLFEIDRVDVVNLATVKSPVLKFNAVFDGKPIFVKDQATRFFIERKIMQEYEDTKYLREKQSYYLRKHIKEGTFGQAPLSPKQEKSFLEYAHR